MTRKNLVRRLGAWFGGAMLLAWANGAALAQNYPAQPVKILLPYAAGGVADITARVIGQKLSQQLGQQFIVDNRPSAGQIVATEAAMKAEPDGYTLLWLNQGHAVSVSLFKSLPYDPVRDFAPISTVGFFGLALLVNSDSPYRSVKDFIAAAKANPGKFNVGATSIGGTQFIAVELFKSMAGLEFQTVPFKATPAIITAVKGNDLHAMVDRLNKEIRAAVAAPEVKQRLQYLGVDASASSPESLRELLISETAKWKAVVERAKIEKQ